jgi:hypothetical protein
MTVGRNEEVAREHIKKREKEDKLLERRTLF